MNTFPKVTNKLGFMATTCLQQACSRYFAIKRSLQEEILRLVDDGLLKTLLHSFSQETLDSSSTYNHYAWLSLLDVENS